MPPSVQQRVAENNHTVFFFSIFAKFWFFYWYDKSGIMSIPEKPLSANSSTATNDQIEFFSIAGFTMTVNSLSLLMPLNQTTLFVTRCPSKSQHGAATIVGREEVEENSTLSVVWGGQSLSARKFIFFCWSLHYLKLTVSQHPLG